MVKGFPNQTNPAPRQGHFTSEINETKEILTHYKHHKSWIIANQHLYSGFDYNRLLRKEIQSHDIDPDINRDIFFKHDIVTPEILDQLVNINLKTPIEAYLYLKSPLTIDDLITDIETFGERLLKDSGICFAKIKTCLKKSLKCLEKQEVILNQLAILKTEDPKKYSDMIYTGILNFVIEKQFTDDWKALKDSFISGILHDIGFLYLDEKYRNRSASQFSIVDLKKIQYHAELGYHLLKSRFNGNVINAAINHHIGEDSTGYPRQMAIHPNHLSKLTCFASAFISCLRKHKLERAVKIQEIYSREQSHYGDDLKPFFKRDFYTALKKLDLKFNQSGANINLVFNRKDSVVLHNFLVYINGLSQDLSKIDALLLDYIKDRAAHRQDIQNDVDDIFDHMRRINIILKSCGMTPGLRQIMKDNTIASSILSDLEIIFMELHRNNRFLIGLFSFLNAKVKDAVFESTVFKKALVFSKNIQLNISSRMNKGSSIFDLLSTIEV